MCYSGFQGLGKGNGEFAHDCIPCDCILKLYYACLERGGVRKKNRMRGQFLLYWMNYKVTFIGHIL